MGADFCCEHFRHENLLTSGQNQPKLTLMQMWQWLEPGLAKLQLCSQTEQALSHGLQPVLQLQPEFVFF